LKRKTSTSRGFTLIELILVMTVLTIAVSVTAPALANFFRGRTLDSEARRLLALIRHGQSRAVSEGIPVELWFDEQQGVFGLEAEPSYEPADTRAVRFTLDADLKIEVVKGVAGLANIPMEEGAQEAGLGAVGQVLSTHPDLPRIRFLPDGSFGESSPQILRLVGRDGGSIWVVQSRNQLIYELRARNEP
jgi:prepilin-type N-terminal cleavage/methylation domain-containing protein